MLFGSLPGVRAFTNKYETGKKKTQEEKKGGWGDGRKDPHTLGISPDFSRNNTGRRRRKWLNWGERGKNVTLTDYKLRLTLLKKCWLAAQLRSNSLKCFVRWTYSTLFLLQTASYANMKKVLFLQPGRLNWRTKREKQVTTVQRPDCELLKKVCRLHILPAETFNATDKKCARWPCSSKRHKLSSILEKYFSRLASNRDPSHNCVALNSSQPETPNVSGDSQADQVSHACDLSLTANGNNQKFPVIFPTVPTTNFLHTVVLLRTEKH